VTLADIIDSIGNYQIRAISDSMLSNLKEWRNAQMDVLRQNRILTDEDQQRWWSSLKNNDDQVQFGLYTVTPQPALIGYGGLVYLNFEYKRAEVSFLLDPKRAAVRETYRADLCAAFTLFLRYGFERLGLHRVYTETFGFRDEHIAILEDFGLRREGVFRDHVFKKGRFWDSILHGMLRSEWDALQLGGK